MTLGIKYCGGCNPTYDRVASVTELKKSLSDLEIEINSYSEEESFDYCLLVRGCRRSCVSECKFTNCRFFYTASEPADFLKIAQIVREHTVIEKDDRDNF